MFAAKQTGARYEVYSPELDRYSPRRLALAAELRAAIAACEVEVHYQPKIRVDDGAVVGVEALARWVSPAHGRIGPVEFIPIAERTGLIKPLTRAVLRTSAEFAVRAREEGRDLGVAVNVSPRSLRDHDFVRDVSEIVASTRVDTAQLTLEITESSVLGDSPRAAGAVERITDLGITMSIDDFGTGYASVGYLQRLPIAEVKIDRSFVAAMDGEPAARAIVESTVHLAHRLGLSVVAEGVETARTLEMLAEAGCDYAQGYLIARPMPEANLIRWLDSGCPHEGVVTSLTERRKRA
jgi:EAL domain-containing protein (putative c-di-GMP-specific phosphodiesterase class I)